MRKWLLSLGLLLAIVAPAAAQTSLTHLTNVAALPTTCRLGDLVYKTGAGAGIYKATTAGVGTCAWTFVGNGVPAGSDGQIQYNSGGLFGADASFVRDAITQAISVTRASPAGDGKDVLALLQPGTTPRGAISFDAGTSTNNQIGFGMKDYVAQADKPSYFFRAINAGNPVSGIEVLPSETAGNPIAYTTGIGQSIGYDAEFIAGAQGLNIYQYGGLGAGAISGLGVQVDRNTSGTGAASFLSLQQKDGTRQYMWFDNTGAPRYGSAPPTEDNTTVSDTSGTTFGGGGSGTVTTTGTPVSGDIAKFSGSSSITTATSGTDYVAPGAITSSGLTQASGKILGRSTASTGAIEEITVGSGLSLSGGSLTATAGGGGTVTNTGTLVSGKAIIGNGSADVTVSSASGVAHLSSGTLTGSNVDLTSEVTGTLPVGNLPASVKTRAFGITIDGAGSTITTGVKGFIQVPFTGTITSWTLLSTDASATSGSIAIELDKDTYANYPPDGSDKICASACPSLSSANKNTDSTLTGWTTSVTAGDVVGINVTSATTVTRVTFIAVVTGS